MPVDGGEGRVTEVGTVFCWAQSYFDFGDFGNARKWYERCLDMGVTDEEAFLAAHRLAVSMDKLEVPWPDVQEAYLRAWERRPSRAEPLHAIAAHYRSSGRYHLGYLFARRAARLPRPEHERLAVDEDVYNWRAADELSVCAGWIGKKAEGFALCRQLLARADIPEDARQRIAKNRDFGVAEMLDAALAYSAEMVDGIAANTTESAVTVSLVAGSSRRAVEGTLNSFLNCCRDRHLIGRLIILDRGLSTEDRHVLREMYPFVEWLSADPSGDLSVQLRELRAAVDGRFWLHLSSGWQFFAPEDLITRLSAVLDAEPQVFQVGVNVADSRTLIGRCAPESAVSHAPNTGRYVRANVIASGPAMLDTARLDQVGSLTVATSTGPDGAGMHTATLDEVLCILQ